MGKSICVEKVGSIQIFQKEDGSYDAFDFATSEYISDPYKDKPKGYKPVVFKKTPEQIAEEIDDISRYQTIGLEDRKLKEQYLRHYDVKIGVSEEDGTSPVLHYYPYTKAGELVGYKVRLVENKRMWSVGDIKSCDLFGWDKAIQTGAKRLYITEGELDCVALFQIFKEQSKGTPYADFSPAVVSLAHGASSAARDIGKFLPAIRERFKEIVLVFDDDEPGRKAAEEVVRICPEALVARLPCKDANECLIQGRSKAAHAAVQFQAAKPKNTRLVQVSDVAEAAKKEPEWGFSYPFKQLTDLTRGMRLGEVTYWGAGVKLGKSELLNALVSHCIVEHGWKCFVAKAEEGNVRTLQGVVGKVVNRIFHDPKIKFDHEAFDKGLEIIGDKLIMLNLYQELSWEHLKTDIRAAAMEGCKFVCIDPITVLINGIDAAAANTLLQKIAQELAAMAMDLQISVAIFCHLKAPTAGEPHERGGAVQSYQFAGSRAMMRSAHCMVGLEGNKDPDLSPEERNIRTLVLLEDRHTGASGKVKIYWNESNGTFNEIF